MTNSWSFLYDEMNYKINDFDVDIPPTDTATNIFEYTYGLYLFAVSKKTRFHQGWVPNERTQRLDLVKYF